MAYNTTTPRVEYTASAGQTVFTFLFKVFLDSDLKVYLTPSGTTPDVTADLLTLTTDYTVTINGDSGGSITLTNPTSVNDGLVLVRRLPVDRDTEYQTNGDLLASTLNNDQEYQTYLISDNQASANQHLTLKDNETGVSNIVPSPVASGYLRWNSTGTALLNDTSAQIVRDDVNLTVGSIAELRVLTTTPDTVYATAYDVSGNTVGAFGSHFFKLINSAATDNSGTIIVPTGVTTYHYALQYSGAVNVKWFGASELNTKESNTEIIKDVINFAYSPLLPTVNGGANILIPSNIKWSENSLLSYMSGTVSSASSVTIEDLNITEDMIGCFVWNTTDYSYGWVVSYTTTSVTVNSLLLGVTNTFTIGDAFVISYLKVGVNIIDESKYSEVSNVFTGQIKNFLNSKLPSSYSANEQWAWGQYHPAYIVSNNNPSDMESRASFISRKYNINNKIQSFMQIGLSPLNHTNSTSNPSDASRVLLVGGHNKGVDTNNATSAIFCGFKASGDMLGTYMSIGTYPRVNYSIFQEQTRNEANIIGLNAKGTQSTFIKFLNDEVIHDTWRVWGTTGGVSGIRKYTAAKTSNYVIPDNNYSGGHFINTGASGIITIYVPNIVDSLLVGSTFTITVDEAFQVSVVSVVGSVIRGVTTAIRSSTVGSSITVVATKVGVYDIISQTGTWTIS